MDSWKDVVTWIAGMLMVAAILISGIAALYYNSEHSRHLMQVCLEPRELAARTPADCHNGVYGHD